MIGKALRQLTHCTTEKDFDHRLITGLTVGGDPKKLPEARKRLMSALYEIAEFLADGDNSEVFHLGSQLFPLTKIK